MCKFINANTGNESKLPCNTNSMGEQQQQQNVMVTEKTTVLSTLKMYIAWYNLVMEDTPSLLKKV